MKCYDNKNRFKILPQCETEEGCPIESIATQDWAEELIMRFYEARMLYEATKVQIVYQKSLEKLGLLDDLDLLFNLEFTFFEIRKYQHNKELAKQKLTKR